MSYNPAFVSDESPVANSSGADHCQADGGIKLISFKVLPKANQANPNHNVVLDLAHQNQHNNNSNNLDESGAGGNSSSSRSSSLKQRLRAKNAAQNQHNQSKLASSNLNTTTTTSPQSQNDLKSGKQATCKTNGAALSAATNASAKQQQQQQHKSAAGNFCMSTSSSLSLIDNPTLSSLTPSASSYSTTSSSSIVSSSSGLCAAVECRDMRYDVGRGRNQKTILYNINVTVPEGSIYGLLGPSGCGKTTMLRCVVGRIKPKEGYVRVFGYRPNDSGSQIPGPAIGYMPQVSRILYSVCMCVAVSQME